MNRSDYGSTKLKVENLHYDLTEDDLDVCLLKPRLMRI